MHWFIITLAAIIASTRVATAAPVDYHREIRPILMRHCCQCHGAKKQKSMLRLDSAKTIQKGGSLGPAIVAGNSAESLLYQVITDTSNTIVAMPPETDPPEKTKPLSKKQIDLIKRWIDEGARFKIKRAGEMEDGDAENTGCVTSALPKIYLRVPLALPMLVADLSPPL